MYEFIRGTLKASSPTYVVVEAHGIGYRLHTSISAWTKLPAIGFEVTLFLSFYVREDAHRLYGFVTKEERDLFERLTALSGIGPKTALSLLGHMEIEILVQAIQQENVSLLCKIPGIGKKTAERLLIELKGDKSFLESSHFALSDEMRSHADALNALIHLGYPASAAQKALITTAKERPESSLSALITSALGLLTRTTH